MSEALAAMGSVVLDPYLILLIFGTTILGVVIGVLPGLVAALTPLPHGRLISRSKDALMTAFATGRVLPVKIYWGPINKPGPSLGQK